MERESELVKVTGIMSLWRCWGRARSAKGDGVGVQAPGLAGVENGRGAAPCSTSAFPGNIQPLRPCQHGGASWQRTSVCTARSLLPLTVYRASAAIRTVTGFLHTA